MKKGIIISDHVSTITLTMDKDVESKSSALIALQTSLSELHSRKKVSSLNFIVKKKDITYDIIFDDKTKWESAVDISTNPHEITIIGTGKISVDLALNILTLKQIILRDIMDLAGLTKLKVIWN